ncbi:MAG: DUF5055 domain-containing protein [Acutalibacteraceae bacterium]
MSKTLEFTYEGTPYTLEYTRKSVEIMERQGFDATKIESKPMTCLPALFRGAFMAHHKKVKPEKIDEMYSKMTNKTELIGKLSEMYSEPILTLVEDPEDDEGNIEWGASF